MIKGEKARPRLLTDHPALAVILDSAIILLAFLLAYTTRFHGELLLAGSVESLTAALRQTTVRLSLHLAHLAFSGAVLLFALYQNGAYSPRPVSTTQRLGQIVGACLWAAVFGGLLVFLFPELRRSISRLVVLGQFFFIAPALFAWRVAGRSVEISIKGEEQVRLRALIVGAGKIGTQLGELLKAQPQIGYELAGFLDDRVRESPVDGSGILGSLKDFEEIAKDHHIEVVFITIPSDREQCLFIADSARSMGIQVRIVPDLFELLTREIRFESIGPFTVAALFEPTFTHGQRLVKRLEDLIVASFSLVTLSPVLAVLAVAIRLDSGGPVLFRQRRVGENGNEFTMLKLRTMTHDTEEEDHRDLTRHYIRGDAKMSPEDLYKKAKGRGVTRVGKFIRRFGLDEIPQFWNVLRGEMSVVGPRPPLPYEFDEYPEYYRKRMLTKPGITGLWQIGDRYRTTFDQMIVQDLRYINEWSLWLDLRIILETIPVLVRGSGL